MHTQHETSNFLENELSGNVEEGSVPMCSLIITTYKAHEHLQCCVESILRFSPSVRSSIEVVLYGDGGGVESAETIARCAQKLTDFGIFCSAKYNPQNLGIVQALNAACALAKGTWLFIMNDDMVFPVHWFEETKAHLRPMRVLSLRCIEPKLVGRSSASCFVVKTLGTDPLNFNFSSLDNFNRVPEATGDMSSNVNLSANVNADARLAQGVSPIQTLERGVNYPFFIERELYFRIGGADSSFPGPYHDPDLFYRLHLAKAELVRLSSPLLYHFSGVSLRFGEAGKKVTARWIKTENQARLVFIRKWGQKPKAKFGFVPKMSVGAPLAERKLSTLARVGYCVLLAWEIVRCRFRELRYARQDF